MSLTSRSAATATFRWVIVGCGLLLACGRSAPTGAGHPPDQPSQPPASPAPTHEPVIASPPASPLEMSATCLGDTPVNTSALVSAINAFGADLYTHWGDAGSFVVAPAGIALALLNLLDGARGVTAEQLVRALHLGAIPAAERSAAARSLLCAVFGSETRTAGLAWASRMFVDDSLQLAAAFAERSRHDFFVDIETTQFRQDANLSRLTINRWASLATGGLVAEILPPSAVSAATRLVVVNALAMKAAWQQGFDPDRTRDARFTGGTVTMMPTMRQTALFPFGENARLSSLELEYQAGRTSLLLMLPKAALGVASIESGLGSLDKLLPAPTPQNVQLSLPRFSLAARQPQELSRVLLKLGIFKLFGSSSELTGLVQAGSDAALSLTGFYQSSVVEVDETGTRAVAATAVAGARTGHGPLVFDVNRPFVFLIRDKATGLVLFMGRYLGV